MKKSNRKCPNCNSTKTNQTPIIFICKNCGFKNDKIADLKIVTYS